MVVDHANHFQVTAAVTAAWCLRWSSFRLRRDAAAQPIGPGGTTEAGIPDTATPSSELAQASFVSSKRTSGSPPTHSGSEQSVVGDGLCLGRDNAR
ncbi:MAG: hypothetical protein R3C59_29260 [Planctomycetaceae bacterium]